MRQILLNLVGNAIKFTESGTVRLILAFRQLPDELPWVTIRVEDTGIGMSTEQVANLFTPFSQADTTTTRRFGGTGLGLTISKRLAKLFGGDIEVTSEPDVGSAFDLILPVSVLPDTEFVSELPPRPNTTQRAQMPRLVGRVLLVEDGPDNQKLISLALEKAGAEVEIAENGQAAVERIADGEAFDVILMDMQMPVLDGYSATRRLRDLGCSCPIVALTAHAMPGDRERCLEAGCTDYETKPIRRRQLLETLGRFL